MRSAERTHHRRGSRLRGLRRARLLVVFAASAATCAVISPGIASAAAQGETRVIVRLRPGMEAVVREQVRALDGTVEGALPLIDGLIVDLPHGASVRLASSSAVVALTPDGSLDFLGDEWKPDKDLGAFYTINKSIGAQDLWSRRDVDGATYTGAGIGVALIDSGVVPVDGLRTPGKVINGPDLSFESQSPDVRYLDTFGHGTHMAGIIAGRDDAVKPGLEHLSSNFVGVAPGAHIISIKVAAADGATDVSQVIAAIDWVVTHRDDPGLNIRVLNLSFGTTALQPYQLDPLTYAVEQAWLEGIVVVVAAGNEGAEGTSLTNPAIDPYVIAVGASDHAGTENRRDDLVAAFSSVGGPSRGPDLVAPGRSVVSLRAPGSWLDERHATARVGDGSGRFFRGSGTSQAAAVISGAVALVLDERPELTPDQVKYVLTANADLITGSATAQGAGLLDLKDIRKIDPRLAPEQTFERAQGTGSLELARGGSHVADPETGVELTGEFDFFGRPWDAASWTAASAAGTAWSGGTWIGAILTGSDWDGTSWTGKTWRAAIWLDSDWTGKTWRSDLWSGKTWRDSSWTGKTWRDATWSGKTWRDATWSGSVWR